MLNKYEKQKIEAKIRSELSTKGFNFGVVHITVKNERLLLVFEDSVHSYFKNVTILSHASTVKETPLYTQVYINLRFLYGKRISPIIGHNIISFKMVL